MKCSLSEIISVVLRQLGEESLLDLDTSLRYPTEQVVNTEMQVLVLRRLPMLRSRQSSRDQLRCCIPQPKDFAQVMLKISCSLLWWRQKGCALRIHATESVRYVERHCYGSGTF